MTASHKTTFPDVIIGVDKIAPRILRPSVDDNGVTSVEIIWEPKEGDESLKSSYTDVKRVTINGIDSVLVTRTKKQPHVMAINYHTRSTYWSEKGNDLSKLQGGVHTATYVDSPVGHGSIAVGIPFSKDTVEAKGKFTNMMYINIKDKRAIECDFQDNHASLWIDKGDGLGGGILWAVGRDTPQNAKNAKQGKCILRGYYPSEDGDINPRPRNTDDIILVDSPEELTYMNQKGWYESPHDITRRDINTLWISTESRVVAYNFLTKKLS
ncbi:hypothetical protein SC206_20975 [Rouxiella sp. T17]|uniref:hypothetical protein n=1 Tax=Rouxiella sp. T17 TaxID=3085684 RepID=UPI002FCBD032